MRAANLHPESVLGFAPTLLTIAFAFTCLTLHVPSPTDSFTLTNPFCLAKPRFAASWRRSAIFRWPAALLVFCLMAINWSNVCGVACHWHAGTGEHMSQTLRSQTSAIAKQHAVLLTPDLAQRTPSATTLLLLSIALVYYLQSAA